MSSQVFRISEDAHSTTFSGTCSLLSEHCFPFYEAGISHVPTPLRRVQLCLPHTLLLPRFRQSSQVWANPGPKASPCTSCASAPYPSTRLAPVCQFLSYSGASQTGPSIPDVVSQGLTREGAITSLSWTAIVLLMQPSMWLAFFAAWAVWWRGFRSLESLRSQCPCSTDTRLSVSGWVLWSPWRSNVYCQRSSEQRGQSDFQSGQSGKQTTATKQLRWSDIKLTL